ncbi:MAG: tRNA lysidine(34) synthetase TilS [Synechococcaceae cyanobacterium]|nr:tRNA lysidine(34) synthetase TilS [Synechococcaceae cyanobacterium]
MILPPGTAPWSPDHQRLHRWLRRQPGLLPAGAPLLLAVSGGQDSMALTALLLGLRPHHGWRLHLWHGDHGWRPESAEQAAGLAAWATGQGLEVRIERAAVPPDGEAEARAWRYGAVAREAQRLGCAHVVTGHTASDRAETVLLNLARGSHRRGLTTPRSSRALHGAAGAPQLVRPLLRFSRSDTARLCQTLKLPVWPDAGNDDPRFARNRVRAEVLPVLEALHPGAAQRISGLAERWGEEWEREEELLALALQRLARAALPPGRAALARRELAALAPANQARLLQHWLQAHSGRPLASEVLAELVARLPPQRGNGRMDLAKGWRLCWEPSTLVLISTDPHG